MNPRYHLRKPRDLNAALQDLRGFWKLWSACLLSRCGLPTLRGIIVTAFYPTMGEEIRAFLEDAGSTRALIRHDKRREAPPYPRGGFLVGLGLLTETVQFFLDLGRIVAVYEPADPLLNMHNMSLLFESEREVHVEILGPGFDASDLNRGDISPHETFSVGLSPAGAISRVRLVQRVQLAAYLESVILRKEKIKKRLESAPSAELAPRIRKSAGIPEDLDAYLQAIGSPLCEPQGYAPVSEDLLRGTIAEVIGSHVINRYLESTGVGFPLVLSTSLVNKGEKQVFWDIVSGALKFEGLHSRTALKA